MSRIDDDKLMKLESDSLAGSEQATRQVAIKQIERRRGFHVLAAVSTIGVVLLVAVWAISEYYNAGGWPTDGFSQSSGIPNVWNIWIIYPILGWVALLAVNGWITYLRKPISENDVMREMERQTGTRR